MESNEGNSEENMLVTKSTGGGGGGCDNSVTVKTSYQRSDLLKTKKLAWSRRRIRKEYRAVRRPDSVPTTVRRRRRDVVATMNLGGESLRTSG